MTHRTGRFGRKFARSDPRGHWGTGVPASAGFMPEEPVILQRSGHTFAQTSPDDVVVSRVDVTGGYSFSGSPLCRSDQVSKIINGKRVCIDKPIIMAEPHATPGASPGGSLSRQGAQQTRGARRSRRRKRRR